MRVSVAGFPGDVLVATFDPTTADRAADPVSARPLGGDCVADRPTDRTALGEERCRAAGARRGEAGSVGRASPG